MFAVMVKKKSVYTYGFFAVAVGDVPALTLTATVEVIFPWAQLNSENTPRITLHFHTNNAKTLIAVSGELRDCNLSSDLRALDASFWTSRADGVKIHYSANSIRRYALCRAWENCIH